MISSFLQSLWDISLHVDTWARLERLSTIICIITIFPVIGLCGWVWKQRPRKKLNPNGNEFVLMVHVGEGSISRDVLGYAKNHIPTYKANPAWLDDGNHSYEVHIANKDAAAEDMRNLRSELEALQKRFLDAGVRHIHLFLKAPVVACAIVGDELANRYNITYYTLNRNLKSPTDTEIYVCWGNV